VLAVVLEAEAQHFGNGDDVLADGEIAEDLLVDVLGKEQGANSDAPTNCARSWI